LRPFLEARAVRRAIVFGSYARGTQTKHSDLDLALIMDTDKRFLERSDGVSGIEDLVPGVPMELLIYARGELEAIAHRPFIRSLLTEGVVIYER
jgi:uncharacterized protein